MAKISKIAVFHRVFEVPTEVEQEQIEFHFSPKAPVGLHFTEVKQDYGAEVLLLADGIYFVKRYGRRPSLAVDKETITLTANAASNFQVIITDPAAIDLDLLTFGDVLRGEFEIARAIKEAGGGIMTTRWQIFYVDKLPDVASHRLIAEAYSLVVTVGDNSADETRRNVYVVNDRYPTMNYELF